MKKLIRVNPHVNPRHPRFLIPERDPAVPELGPAALHNSAYGAVQGYAGLCLCSAVHVEDSLVKLLLAADLLGLADLLGISHNVFESHLALFELLALAAVE